ncbi:MAG TPA: alpha/beta hydrolase [Actinospica sp.]|jgi:acetyl esterase/lipase|nr:alpha/beta hydrolase [Actinospica sp.]
MPRDLGLPRTLGLQRRLDALSRLRRVPDVSVIQLPTGASVRLHEPAPTSAPTPALLWIHGGGYVIGAAQQEDRLCRAFAAALGITVAAVDYRLAPEHPYPASLDDCGAAFEWLVDHPTVEPTKVAVGGASAGGGLAAALAIRARDLGLVSPTLQLLSYPMLDDRTGPDDARAARGFRWWGPRSNRFGWASYLGDCDPDIAVPARQEDLRRLPAAWIGVGTLDMFHAEDVRYAERLAAAGVPCDLAVIEGAYHGFDAISPRAAVSGKFFESQCAALRASFSS